MLSDPLAGAPERVETVVNGIGVAPGVAIGPAFAYDGGTWEAAREALAPEAVDDELARFEHAIQRSERELRKITVAAREKLGDDSARMFDAQMLVLRDPGFYDDVVRLVRREHVGAAFAVQAVMEALERHFEAAATPRLRERAADFQDIRNRVLRNLQHGRGFSRIEEDRVVVAENLTAADILLFSRRKVRGCVMDFGGPTSHVSIMARALGVPAVVSLHELSGHVRDGAPMIVDGFSGRVILDPTETTLAQYHEKQAVYARLIEEGEALAAASAETIDGRRIALQANIEFAEELPLLEEFGAEGIGLFRTEMLFLAHAQALDEAQQFDVYRDALRAAAPHAVTFRLIDLGGDKLLPMANREPNPFLGWRGVRILLDKPDLLRPQLRAILRAAAEVPEGRARILVPMVTALGEVRAIRAALSSVEEELDTEGVPYVRGVPLGVMVETPAVALMAKAFAAEADFFSVGTNDLTQFTLAVDRGNDLVADQYRELHPAVLCLLARATEAAKEAGIPVSLCGELAADPLATALLVGLGFDTLSVSPAYLPIVKRVVRAMTAVEAEALAVRALDAPDVEGVRALLRDYLTGHNPLLAQLFLSTPAP